jgi:hypothetical protein
LWPTSNVFETNVLNLTMVRLAIAAAKARSLTVPTLTEQFKFSKHAVVPGHESQRQRQQACAEAVLINHDGSTLLSARIYLCADVNKEYQEA